MDRSPIRQTFELGKFISTAGKSIINLVKYRKMWKIQSCEVCILLYYARKTEMWVRFSAYNTKVYKIRKLHMTVFSTFYDILLNL